MLNAVTLAAVGVLALGAPVAVPAVQAAPAVPAVPAVHATPVSWGDGPQEIPKSLDWEIKPVIGSAAPGVIDFQIGYRGEHSSSYWSQGISQAMLGGLSESQLNGAGQPVSFVLHRDAGDFRCTGVAGLGKGVGNCVFAANAAFPAVLAKRGVAGGLADYQQFELAISDIGVAYLDELKRENYATPSTDDLVKAGIHGAGLKQLLAMDAAGYRFGDVASLVRARDHGVTPKYLEALRAAGYTGLSAADLVHLRDHGVSATYISELRDAGYAHLSAEDVTRLRDHGVSGGFVGELHAMGYDRLTPEELMKLRDHGISAGFIRVSNQGGTRLTPDELIRLRERGGPRQ